MWSAFATLADALEDVDAEPLSPARLLSALPESLQIDRSVVGGFALHDCLRLADHEPVRLDYRCGDARIEIDVSASTGEGPPRLAEVAGLGISFRRGSDSAAATSIVHTLAAALRARFGLEPRRWRLLPVSGRHVPSAIAGEIRIFAAELGDDPDGALLLRDAAHHDLCYGARPEAVQVAIRGREVDGLSVRYPAPRNGRVPPSAAVYPVPARVGLRRSMRAHFAGLGVVFDEDLRPRTVPTPATFRRALAGRSEIARLRPRLVAGLGPLLPAITWASYLRRGVLPISIAPSWAVHLHRLVRRVPPLAKIPCDVGMVVHDMGLHALGLHAIPAAAWEGLVDRAVRRVRARGLRLVPRIAGFFEGSLTRTSWEVWKMIDAPADFGPAFMGRLPALEVELDDL